MFEPKRISREGVAAALQKALRYRTLNEPLEAESICLDVLEVDPGNPEALTTLLLALTDQFTYRLHETYDRARELLARFPDPYGQAYYRGILLERRAKAAMRMGGPGSGYIAYECFHEALECFEKAAELRPPGNDDPILRWNTCARYLNRHRDLSPRPTEPQQLLE